MHTARPFSFVQGLPGTQPFGAPAVAGLGRNSTHDDGLPISQIHHLLFRATNAYPGCTFIDYKDAWGFLQPCHSEVVQRSWTVVD